MNDRSVLFNNAGVQVLMMDNGHEIAALDLFRGALESKLVFERSQLQDSSGLVADCESKSSEKQASEDAIESTPTATASEPMECIERAERHLLNLKLYLTPVVITASPAPPAMEQQPALEPPADVAAGTIVVPVHSRGYEPFLYKTPFMIPDDSTVSTPILSSIIVFNLGLVHQRVNRHSSATAVFYEISAALLPGLPTTPETLLLRVALLNNFGVWSFDNGEGESMRTSMEHLAIALNFAETEPGERIDSLVQQGARSNIQWLLTPLHGGSPAA